MDTKCIHKGFSHGVPTSGIRSADCVRNGNLSFDGKFIDVPNRFHWDEGINHAETVVKQRADDGIWTRYYSGTVFQLRYRLSSGRNA